MFFISFRFKSGTTTDFIYLPFLGGFLLQLNKLNSHSSKRLEIKTREAGDWWTGKTGETGETAVTTGIVVWVSRLIGQDK